MGKVVRKFIFDDSWDLGKMESWFTDMAKKGLHLRELGRIFVTFTKGEPKSTKCRVDIMAASPSEEQLVTGRDELYVFSSPEGDNYPELHTDPVEQSFTLEILNRKMRNQVIVLSLCMALFLGMMLHMLFFIPTPTLSMMETRGIQGVLLVFIQLYVFSTVIRNYLSVRCLRKALANGKPLNHQEDWRKWRMAGNIISAFFLITALLTASIPFVEIAKSETYTLPRGRVDLPVVRLQDIEKSPSLERDPWLVIDGVEWGNFASYRWSPLAPVKYEVNEHGVVQNEVLDDKDGPYSPSIKTLYYQLTLPCMADSLINGLIKRHIPDGDSEFSVQEVDHALFDRLVVAENGNRKEIVAGCGNEVIYVSYYGKEQGSAVIDLLPQAFPRTRHID